MATVPLESSTSVALPPLTAGVPQTINGVSQGGGAIRPATVQPSVPQTGIPISQATPQAQPLSLASLAAAAQPSPGAGSTWYQTQAAQPPQPVAPQGQQPMLPPGLTWNGQTPDLAGGG